MKAGELQKQIDEYIGADKSFAVFRLPGESVISCICAETPEVSIYSGIDELNRQSGFVIAPFHVSEECPIVLIWGERKTIEIDLDSFPLVEDAPVTREYHAISTCYEKRYETFMRSLHEKKLDKIVLSRDILLTKEKTFSSGLAFLKACRRYVRSYVYLCHTPQTGTWLGSTPEIILSGSIQNLHTVALAGTQQLKNGLLPEKWDAKNLQEQRYVAEYVKHQLQTLGLEIKEEGPYTVRAGELAHLKSDFRFALPDSDKLGDLLKLLHPTPAVCGYPKEEAYRFIIENEEYNRKYYSGFIGMLDCTGISNIYVNLRCMNIKDEHLNLYAGGGLLTSSTLRDEWQETEDKLYTMKAII